MTETGIAPCTECGKNPFLEVEEGGCTCDTSYELRHPDTGDTAALDELLDTFKAKTLRTIGNNCLLDKSVKRDVDNETNARAAIHTHVAALVQAEREKVARDMADYMPPVPPPATTRHE